MLLYGQKCWQGLKNVVAIGGILLLWQIMPAVGLVDYRSLPPFSDVVKGLVQMVLSGELAEHMLASFQRSAVGFMFAVIIAVPLGMFMGWFRRFEKIADPLVQLCRNTATLVLYPVFILIFGLGELSKIGLILWGSLWPILINTIDGVKNVDSTLIKAARSMAISRWALFCKVVLPAAVPSIITGLRLSATHSIIILVAAEMLGANAGLGFLIFDARHKYLVEKMYAGIVILIMLGMIVNYLMVRLEKHLTRWKGNMVDA